MLLVFQLGAILKIIPLLNTQISCNKFCEKVIYSTILKYGRNNIQLQHIY